MAESAKISILLKAPSALDNDDPGIPATVAVLLLAKALNAVCAKLDADAGVTDTNYASTTAAIAYP